MPSQPPEVSATRPSSAITISAGLTVKSTCVLETSVGLTVWAAGLNSTCSTCNAGQSERFILITCSLLTASIVPVAEFQLLSNGNIAVARTPLLFSKTMRFLISFPSGRASMHNSRSPSAATDAERQAKATVHAAMATARALKLPISL